MRGRFRPRGYYFITDRRQSKKGNAADVRAAREAGVGIIQYREKDLPSGAMYGEAARLKALCAGGLFIVNDRLDVALAVSADGVHVGSDDLPLPVARRILGKKALIGASARTVEEAIAAEAAGADYLGVGPVFATATKPDAGPAGGVELVRRIRRAVRLPLVAIGGITLANAGEVIAAGADMISAISAVVAAEDAKLAMLQFRGLFA